MNKGLFSITTLFHMFVCKLNNFYILTILQKTYRNTEKMNRLKEITLFFGEYSNLIKNTKFFTYFTSSIPIFKRYVCSYTFNRHQNKKKIQYKRIKSLRKKTDFEIYYFSNLLSRWLLAYNHTIF